MTVINQNPNAIPGGGPGNIDPLGEYEAVLADPFVSVIREFDPLGEIDPNHDLLSDCAGQVDMLRRLYGGSVQFPNTYIADMYSQELRYVDRGMKRLREILQMNEDQGIKVTDLYGIFDFDNSQVAVVDIPNELPAAAAGAASSGEDIHVDEGGEAAKIEAQGGVVKSESGSYHVPRVGWPYLVRKMIAEELNPRQIRLHLGTITDRMQNFDTEQTVDTSGADLNQIARREFETAGLLEYLDPSLVLSCTDGELVEQLPPYMRSGMRTNKRREDAGKTVRLPERAMQQIRAGQMAAISEISTPDRLANDELEYHVKVGELLILSRQASPGTILMWWDDIKSTELVHSAKAMGVYIPLVPQEQDGMRTMAPLLPNDLFKYLGS